MDVRYEIEQSSGMCDYGGSNLVHVLSIIKLRHTIKSRRIGVINQASSRSNILWISKKTIAAKYYEITQYQRPESDLDLFARSANRRNEVIIGGEDKDWYAYWRA